MSVVFHIAARAEWETALAAGAYRTGSLDHEGFIHCSTGEQVRGTANTLFVSRADLVLLFIEVERLDAPLRYEPVLEPRGAVFPNIFGPINLAAVFEVVALEPRADGRFELSLEVPALAAMGDNTLEQIEARALTTMEGYGARWWVAGGWAVELQVAAAHGRPIRPHADLEISILRRDQRALFDHLVGWQLCAVVRPGVLEDWDGQLLASAVHQLWARRGSRPQPQPDGFVTDPTFIDILLEESDGDLWRFRRRPSVAGPLADLGATSARGTPFIRPEVSLLYKAKHRRFKDQRDFDATAPTLDATARAWLAAALDQTHPGHPWAQLLRS
ncbi:MAG TPA: DUF952 domain-containing protein [Kofleriaceae bacterium]|nr:DUF952 domain-containing protein [Kofleriaceae bacterium]